MLSGRTRLAGRLSWLVALVWTSAVFGQHIDIQLQVVGNKLQTGRIDFTQPGNPIDTSWRVYEAAFGEVANYTDDPGFSASSGSGLPAGMRIRFNMLDALRVWNPSTQTFNIAPNTLTMSLAGVLTATTPPGCNQVTQGYYFAQASSSGAIHQHIGYLLNPPQTNGVYLLKLEVVPESPSIAKSDPIWIVFSQNDLVNRPIAADYVRATIPPRPCGGDLNGDNVVNGADLSVLLANFGGCAMNNTGADANGDGVVNGGDLSVLLARFGSSCGT